jgi:hypothetical protein
MVQAADWTDWFCCLFFSAEKCIGSNPFGKQVGWVANFLFMAPAEYKQNQQE